MTLFDGLLLLHVAAGSIALLAAGLAVGAKSLGRSHRTHVRAGRTFFWAMLAVFATAVPMSILRANVFLFLVALFSFYLALVGWRLARNRSGKATTVDWLIAGAMAIVSLVMIAGGAVRSATTAGLGAVLLIFGAIAAFLVFRHVAYLRRRDAGPKQRIALHLTMMLAATIATLTAFVVVNLRALPQPVAWLLPSALITPVIVVWRRRVVDGSSRALRVQPRAADDDTTLLA